MSAFGYCVVALSILCCNMLTVFCVCVRCACFVCVAVLRDVLFVCVWLRGCRIVLYDVMSCVCALLCVVCVVAVLCVFSVKRLAVLWFNVVLLVSLCLCVLLCCVFVCLCVYVQVLCGRFLRRNTLTVFFVGGGAFLWLAL